MISLIEAGPGTGKTYSIVYGYLKMSHQILGELDLTDEQETIFTYLQEEFSPKCTTAYFTHSNSAKDVLVKRLGGGKSAPPVYTFNGAGLSAIIKRHGYQKYSTNRTDKHIQLITGQSAYSMNWDQKKYWAAIKRLTHYFKTEARDPDNEGLSYILNKYHDLASYTIPNDALEQISILLEKSLIPDGEVEFADMIYMGKRCIRRPRFTLGFVDESQDISMSSYQLVSRMCEHVIFCGDKNQAINAFAGASEDIYDYIADKSDAILPLKMTLRCPPMICELANDVRPQGIIEGPNKSEGVNKTITYASLPGELAECHPGQTMIIGRTNALIIGVAIYLMKHDIPCFIMDKDIAKEMKGFVKSFKPKNLKDLVSGLKNYQARAARSNNKIWTHVCNDKANAILQIVSEVDTIKELNKFIDDAVIPDKKGYRICTGHKSKGQEADNIIVVNPPIELPVAMDHPISREQEINLHFVVLTRSSLNITWVS